VFTVLLLLIVIIITQFFIVAVLELRPLRGPFALGCHDVVPASRTTSHRAGSKNAPLSFEKIHHFICAFVSELAGAELVQQIRFFPATIAIRRLRSVPIAARIVSVESFLAHASARLG
jgi:hypothetical protein